MTGNGMIWFPQVIGVTAVGPPDVNSNNIGLVRLELFDGPDDLIYKHAVSVPG